MEPITGKQVDAHVQDALEAASEQLVAALKKRRAWTNGGHPGHVSSDFGIDRIGDSIAALGRVYYP